MSTGPKATSCFHERDCAAGHDAPCSACFRIRKSTPENDECKAYGLPGLLDRRIEIGIPEIADYEVRRELLPADKLCGVLGYRAQVGQAIGKRFGTDDGDVLIAAQAVTLMNNGDDVVIATSNVRDLSLFGDPAKLRTEIG